MRVCSDGMEGEESLVVLRRPPGRIGVLAGVLGCSEGSAEGNFVTGRICLSGELWVWGLLVSVGEGLDGMMQGEGYRLAGNVRLRSLLLAPRCDCGGKTGLVRCMTELLVSRSVDCFVVNL